MLVGRSIRMTVKVTFEVPSSQVSLLTTLYSVFIEPDRYLRELQGTTGRTPSEAVALQEFRVLLMVRGDYISRGLQGWPIEDRDAQFWKALGEWIEAYDSASQEEEG